MNPLSPVPHLQLNVSDLHDVTAFVPNMQAQQVLNTIARLYLDRLLSEERAIELT